MLIRANWERKWWTKGNRWVERGHYIDSELQMVRRWGWARKTVQRFLARLETEGMIKRIPFNKQYTEIEIVNFDKYQDKGNMQNVEVYNDVVKKVDKKVDKGNPHESKDEGVSVVKQVVNDVANDVVITNKSNKEITTTTSEQQILTVLQSVKNYPFDYDTDLNHIRALSTDYPNIDILTEVKKWASYKLDQPLKKGSKPRSQLRNWMQKAVEFSKRKPKPTVNDKLKLLEDM